MSANPPGRPAGVRLNINLAWTAEITAGTRPEIPFCRQDRLLCPLICSYFHGSPDILPRCTIRYVSYERTSI
jgi:hypothetical protein